MGETTDSIRRDIDRERHQLEANLEGIEAKVKETTTQMQDKVEDVQHQVQDKVEEVQHQVQEKVQDVQTKMKDATDWRTQFDRRPMVGLAVAFGGGVLLASMMGGGSKDRNQGGSGYRGSYGGYQPQYQAYGSHQSYGQYQGNGGSHSEGGMEIGKQHVASTFDNVKGAIMGVAAAQLKSVLSDALPGFDDEYKQVEKEKQSGSSSSSTSQSQSAVSNSSKQQTASGERRTSDD